MSNYYLLIWKHKPELASAFALREPKLDYELISQLDGKSSLPFDFKLKKVKEGRNELIVDDDLSGLSETWLDYQPNNLAWPLMSEKMKSIIEKETTKNEGIDWLSCNVKGRNEERIYYVLRFNKMLDVLDMEKTTFVRGTDHIIRPVFSVSKIQCYNIFSKPSSHDLWRITSGIYVSEVLKKAIQREKLTGVSFEKTSVA